MRKEGIINPGICAEIARLGHTEYLVIADSGLPISEKVKCIDLSLIYGKPGFCEVLKAVKEDLVVESYIVSEEMKQENPTMNKEIEYILGGIKSSYVAHETFKEMTNRAKVVIRTGERTPFSNVILVGGTGFC